MESVQKFFRIDRREICFLHWIVESYEGLATVTTIDPASGFVCLSISPGSEGEVAEILQELSAAGIMMETMERPI